jgi:hypothetical protein
MTKRKAASVSRQPDAALVGQLTTDSRASAFSAPCRSRLPLTSLTPSLLPSLLPLQTEPELAGNFLFGQGTQLLGSVLRGGDELIRCHPAIRDGVLRKYGRCFYRLLPVLRHAYLHAEGDRAAALNLLGRGQVAHSTLLVGCEETDSPARFAHASKIRARLKMVLYLGPPIAVNIRGQVEYRRSVECLHPRIRKWFTVRTHKLFRERDEKSLQSAAQVLQST